MAQKVLVNLDLSGNQLLQALLEAASGNPTALGVGHIYFNTTADEIRVYNGSTWVTWGAGGGGGDMSASTYDPGGIGDDAFDMDNMVEGAATKVLTQVERTKLTGIEALADVTDAANVATAGAQMTSEKGAANGYAELDGAGKVPSAQLPSFVDDVIEAADFASLPGSGETGIMYITLDNDNVYRWSGSAYVLIADVLSASDIESLYEGLADTNKFTDDEKTKVAGATGKFAASVGDGSATAIAITHNLDSQDVVVSVRELSTNDQVICDVQHNSVNQVTLTFASAPSTNQYRATVVG